MSITHKTLFIIKCMWLCKNDCYCYNKYIVPWNKINGDVIFEGISMKWNHNWKYNGNNKLCETVEGTYFSKRYISVMSKFQPVFSLIRY